MQFRFFSLQWRGDAAGAAARIHKETDCMTKRICLRLALLALAACLLFGRATAEEIDVGDWLAELNGFVDGTGNRLGYTENELNAGQWLARRFEELGYNQQDGTLLIQEAPTSMGYMMEYGWEDGSLNIIATKHAASESPRIVIVCAHYDTYFDTVGAKDNGSGVAALLVLAERYAAREAYADTEIRFIGFSCEERGGFGSVHYLYDMSEDELERVIGAINIDVITLNADAENVALSCNTLGGYTPEGYQDGSEDAPIHNRISKAFERALFEVGSYTEQQRGVDFCVPRHWGASDHIAFNDAGVDAATVCFQGNLSEGGSWPWDMHTIHDVVKDFDLERTEEALRVLDCMLDGLARDRDYGQ